MSDFSSPYSFVPLSPFILSPDWASRVSHDQPFQQGLCGELAFELTNDTPLCVGGKQTPSSQTQPGRVHFFTTPEGVPAIPGSSLKGMLRQVMAIATFGHFDQVEEKKLSVRELKDDKHPYRKVMQNTPLGGWLRFTNGAWQLTPCQFTRVHQRTLIEHFGIDEQKWKLAKQVKERYTLLQGLRAVKFNKLKHKNLKEGITENLDHGTHNGTLVVTGQPGSDFTAGKSAKKWEFVFYNETDPITLSREVITDFLFVHDTGEEDSPWQFWKDKTGSEQSVPVFWHPKPGNPSSPASIGLARMYRLAYNNSLHDAIRNTNADHVDNTSVDFADLIFGRMESNETHNASLRGRVNIGLSITSSPDKFRWTDKTVLNAPKPSFYPAYIRQDANEGTPYNTLMSKKPELAGWKRYPVKYANVIQPTGNSHSEKSFVELETLPAHHTFTGKIRFHNLLPVELGALLWCLDFGKDNTRRHSLGMGKPFGLGQVGLYINEALCQIRPNDPTLPTQALPALLGGCREIFIQYMDNAWQTVSGDPKAKWQDSEPLRQLLGMASPDEASNRQLDYLSSPKAYQNVKSNHDKLGDYIKPLNNHPTLDITRAIPPLNTPLQDAIARYEQDCAEAAKRQQQQVAMQTMPAEQRKLVEIRLCLDNPDIATSKTLRKKLELLIKDGLSFDPEQVDQNEAETLLRDTEALGVKVINKACKKLRDHLAL